MVKSSSQSRNRDTEQRILDAAHVVFMRRGTAGARMQEIAKEADVNSALLHY
jgi:AcrR family transcriptional regulator